MDAHLMGHRDPGSSTGFAVYWLCDSYALALTRNKLPCNGLCSVESNVTFIMYSPQGKSSRAEREDQGSASEQEQWKTGFTSTMEQRMHSRLFFFSFFLASRPSPASSSHPPFLFHPLPSSLVFILTSPPLPFILASTLPSSSSPPPWFASPFPPPPCLLLWFLFPDETESERKRKGKRDRARRREPPDTLDQWQ